MNFILDVEGLVFEKLQNGEARSPIHLDKLFDCYWATKIHVKDLSDLNRFVVGVTQLQDLKSVGVSQVHTILHVQNKVIKL